MNTKKSKRVIRIDFDTRTPEQKSDQELASKLAREQDHTCCYDKLRADSFEPSVQEIREHVSDKPQGSIGMDEYHKAVKNRVVSGLEPEKVESAKKDVEACENFLKELERWKVKGKDLPKIKVFKLEPDAELVQKYHDYKEKVDEFLKTTKIPKFIARAFFLDEYPEDNKPVEPERPFGEKVFKEYTDRMLNTYIKKNSDYGSSFDELFDEYGMDSVLIRLKDKYNRLKSLTKPGQKQMVLDESMEDTLLDLANYCILTLVKIRKNKSQEKVSE